MMVAIHQPQYLPWLGYFNKIKQADIFCFLDTVQFKKNEWQNRNRIKTAQGWQWLTVPVRFRFPDPINAVRIQNRQNWRHKHLQALMTNYRKTPFFDAYFSLFRDIYDREWRSLAELNIMLIEQLTDALGVPRPLFLRASSLAGISDHPTDRLIDICQSVSADTYLSGPAGADYMDVDRFRGRGVSVIFQDFAHPVYPQRFGEFISHLSAVDLLFNRGPESVEDI